MGADTSRFDLDTVLLDFTDAIDRNDLIKAQSFHIRLEEYFKLKGTFWFMKPENDLKYIIYHSARDELCKKLGYN